MPAVQVISLNRDEIMTLTDRVQATDYGTDEKRVHSYELLLKMGSAYLEAVTLDGVKGPDIPIALTEAEAWLLRGKVSSSDKLANDPLFGVKLLRKLYALLEAYNGIGDVLLAEDPSGATRQSVRDALTRWRANDAGAGANDTHD